MVCLFVNFGKEKEAGNVGFGNDKVGGTVAWPTVLQHNVFIPSYLNCLAKFSISCLITLVLFLTLYLDSLAQFFRSLHIHAINGCYVW